MWFQHHLSFTLGLKKIQVEQNVTTCSSKSVEHPFILSSRAPDLETFRFIDRTLIPFSPTFS